jgi:hypothetical protein
MQIAGPDGQSVALSVWLREAEMSDIFVSYASEDQIRVDTLVRALKKEGVRWNVFWDRHVPAGKNWRDVLNAELTRAKCVVVVWSRTSIGSHWVLEEAEFSRRRGVLLPVLIERVSPPLGFQSIEAGDLSNWKGDTADARWTRVVTVIRELVGRPTRQTRQAESEEATTTLVKGLMAFNSDKYGEARGWFEKAAAAHSGAGMMWLGVLPKTETA